jgi:hypothetical protein
MGTATVVFTRRSRYYAKDDSRVVQRPVYSVELITNDVSWTTVLTLFVLDFQWRERRSTSAALTHRRSDLLTTAESLQNIKHRLTVIIFVDYY